MPRFDCGGYLNIVTDERDLTQVNVTLTHATAHTPYAEKPEDVPLEETPWLLATGELDDSNMMGVQGQGVGSIASIGSSQVSALPHAPSGRNAFQGSDPTNTTLGQNLASTAIDPALQVIAQPATSSESQRSSAFPYANASSSSTTAAPLPLIMPLSSSSTTTASGTTLSQALPTTTQTAATGVGTAPQSAASTAFGTNPDQSQGHAAGNASGGDRVSLPSDFLFNCLILQDLTGAHHT